MPDVSSPCIKVCVLDPALGICLGCGRTMPEIGNWLRYSDEQRRTVKRELGQRLKRLKDRP